MNLLDEIYYHGSNKKFTEFSFDFIGGGHDQEGPGFYLTSSIDDARKYGRYCAKVQASYSQLVKTSGKINSKYIQFLIKSAPEITDVLMDWDENPKIAYNNFVRSVLDSCISPHDAFQQVWYDAYYRTGHTKQFLLNMIKLGFDGIKIQKEGCHHFIGYNPSKLTILEWGVV